MASQELIVSNHAVAVHEQRELAPLTAQEIRAQVNLIQEVMRAVMQEKQHYGVIPGTDKPTLLKPGAEKLTTTFRLAPYLDIKIAEMGSGHREYQVKCTLKHIYTGLTWGEGVGSCSTLESKYRYRRAEPEDTGRAVPKEYWDLRKTDEASAQELLGGKAFITKKVDGQWRIMKRSDERIENSDIADTYNTCLKMAKKRALVDATLTATAASDIFTQDVEDFVDETTQQVPAPSSPHDTAVFGKEQRPQTSPSRKTEMMGAANPINDRQLTMLATVQNRAGITEEQIHTFLREQYQIESRKQIKQKDLNDILAWIEAKQGQEKEPGSNG